MNIDWLEPKVRDAVRRVLPTEEHVDAVVREVVTTVREPLVRHLNDALSRIKKRTVESIKREREVVA